MSIDLVDSRTYHPVMSTSRRTSGRRLIRCGSLISLWSGVLLLAIACSDSDPTDPVSQEPVWPVGDLIDVVAPGPDHVLVLAGDGQIYISRDAGGTFHEARRPASGPLRSLSMGTASAGFAVGAGVILRTENGGNQWRLQRGPRPGAELDLLKVAAIDELRSIAIGTGGMLLRTVDGGVIWQEFFASERNPSEPPAEWTAIACQGAGSETCVLAGERLYSTLDGGKTWRETPRSDTLTLGPFQVGLGQTEITSADEQKIRAAYANRPLGVSLEWRIDARVSAAEIERIAEDGDPQALFELVDTRGEELRLLLETLGVSPDQIVLEGTPPWGYQDFFDDDPDLLGRYWASRRASVPEIRIGVREPLALGAMAVAASGDWMGLGAGGRGLETRGNNPSWVPFGLTDRLRVFGVARGLVGWVAVGEQGGFFRKGQDESAWQAVSAHLDDLNPTDPSAKTFRAVAFDPAGRTGYAVGDGGLLVVSRDGGQEWKTLSTPAPLAPEH